MIAVLRFLVLAAILVFVAYEIASVDGSISGTVGTVRFETALPVAIGLLLLGLVVLVVVARLLLTVLRLPGRFGVARELRRRRRGEAALTASLLALASGEAADARREAGRARKLLGRTPHTLLAVAEAERLSGRLDGAETEYRGLADRPDTRFLGLRGLVGLALARNDVAEAATLLGEADRARPGTSWIRAERFALACRSGDWLAAVELGPAGGAPRAALAAAAAASVEATDPERARTLATEAHRLEPELAAAALVLGRRLRAAGREGRALAVLRRAWRQAPQPDVAALALQPIADPFARVKAAGEFVGDASPGLETHLLLGRICLEAAMWGEARRHAADASALAPDDRRVLRLVAAIAERDSSLSEPERRAAAAEAIRAASLSATEPAWLCGRCTAELVTWRPVCPACFGVGTVGWTASRRRPEAGADALPPPVPVSAAGANLPLLLGPSAVPPVAT